jgi:uncharacterized membrane protein YjjB (DUF3815 family)
MELIVAEKPTDPHLPSLPCMFRNRAGVGAGFYRWVHGQQVVTCGLVGVCVWGGRTTCWESDMICD